MTVTPNFTPHMAKTVNAKIEKMRGCMMMSDGVMCIFYILLPDSGWDAALSKLWLIWTLTKNLLQWNAIV